jgi:hypothetical protein
MSKALCLTAFQLSFRPEPDKFYTLDGRKLRLPKEISKTNHYIFYFINVELNNNLWGTIVWNDLININYDEKNRSNTWVKTVHNFTYKSLRNELIHLILLFQVKNFGFGFKNDLIRNTPFTYVLTETKSGSKGSCK